MGKTEQQKENKRAAGKKSKRTLIGGQALLEGVMMRGATSVAMAVRAPDGEIELSSERIKKRSKVAKVPIVRGIVSCVS